MMGAEPMLLVEFCEGGDLRRALNLDTSSRVRYNPALTSVCGILSVATLHNV